LYVVDVLIGERKLIILNSKGNKLTKKKNRIKPYYGNIKYKNLRGSREIDKERKTRLHLEY
jgi:hypothetical protein